MSANELRLEIERVPYSPIVTRPKLTLPGGKRLAVFVVPNIEFYEYLPPPSPHRRSLAPHTAPGRARLRHPRLRQPGRAVAPVRGDGPLQRARHRLAERRAARISGHSGGLREAEVGLPRPRILQLTIFLRPAGSGRAGGHRRLRGYVPQAHGAPAPRLALTAITFTANTPDLVAEAGISYYCDWVHDDQPFPMRVRKGRLITMPYVMALMTLCCGAPVTKARNSPA